jgi:hypothetical protein
VTARRLLTLAALALVAASGLIGAQTPEADPVVARAYDVKFRSLADAEEVVSPLLSPDGSVSKQPRLKTITVVDRASVQGRIPALLAGFDLPPRNVEVTLSLFLGTDSREREAGRSIPAETTSRDVRGITETLGDFTKWNAYQPIGGRSITGSEGSRVEAELSDEYRVSYTIGGVQEATGRLKLEGVTLERRVRESDGSVRLQVVYRADITLSAGRMLLVGAAQNPESKKALFLSLQARPK